MLFKNIIYVNYETKFYPAGLKQNHLIIRIGQISLSSKNSFLVCVVLGCWLLVWLSGL